MKTVVAALVVGLVMGVSSTWWAMTGGRAIDGSAAALAASNDYAAAHGRRYVLSPGDEISLPGLDLGCAYYAKVAVHGRLLDCGRVSTDYEGVRVLISPRVVEFNRWSESRGWTQIARARRRP